MIVQLDEKVEAEQEAAIFQEIRQVGYEPVKVETQKAVRIIGAGKKEFDIRRIGNLPGVKDVHRVTDTYKLVSRQWKVEDTRIDLGDGVAIARGELSIMAGPCSIESEEQVDRVVEHLVENGVRIMRGGVFKPRTSPYDFRGLGIEGLKMFYGKARANGINIITEVMDADRIPEMEPYVDIFQVGARNSQNFDLLDALGRIDRPVLLKRGVSGTIDELLQSAEYVFSGGNERIMLCERGIRTYEKAYRNTLDLNAVPLLKEKTHLPVIVDPSHGIGVRKFVPQMAMSAVMAGADGVILETHPNPEEALSDGKQSLHFQEASELYRKLQGVLALREGEGELVGVE
jgi:3-deoxy-7-phosphoheptulonate synthase